MVHDDATIFKGAHDSHQARKACPVAIATLAKVFNNDPATVHLNREELCPLYEQLIADDIWGVRKCCAEALASVADGLSTELKWEVVAGWFTVLARDGSRWVRSAAFKKLGALIATYAAPIPADGLPPVIDEDDNNDGDGAGDGDDGSAPDASAYLEESTTPVKTPALSINGVTLDDASTDDAVRGDAADAAIPETPPPGGMMMGQNVSPRSMRRQDTPRRLNHMSPDGKYSCGGAATLKFDDEDNEDDRSKAERTNASDSKTAALNLVAAFDKLDDETPTDESGAGVGAGAGAGAEGAAAIVSRDADAAGAKVVNDAEQSSEAKEEEAVVPTEIFSQSQAYLQFEASLTNLEKDNAPTTPKQEYNDIQYWKSPIPEFDIDALLGTAPATSVGAHVDVDAEAVGVIALSNSSEDPVACAAGAVDVDMEDAAVAVAVAATATAISAEEATHAKTAVTEGAKVVVVKQAIVPARLIDCFNQMAQAESARTVDIEVARDCAFSFPAILWAVGAAGWSDVRDTYFQLASNDDWRVRSTLAHSIHICAQILGRKITDTDLVAKFDALIDDWDSVKIGVVKHFADFIKVMSPHLRNPYLTRLMDLCETDDVTNWRPRRLLAEQICRIAPLCTPELIVKTMSPLVVSIALNDAVACVRDYFYKSIAVLVGRLANSEEKGAAEDLCNTIAKEFQSNPKGSHRLGFVKICFHYATTIAGREGRGSPPAIQQQESKKDVEYRAGEQQGAAAVAITTEPFERHFLPALFEMTGDNVVNVRVGVARFLSQVMLKYTEHNEELHTKVEAALLILKDDVDGDVKFFASEAPPPTLSNPIPNWMCASQDGGIGDERMAFEE